MFTMRTKLRQGGIFLTAAALLLCTVSGVEARGHRDKEKDSKVKDKAWIGIYLAGTTAGDEGIQVVSVIDGSPAEEAGLRENDVIIMFNGAEIGDEDDFIGQFEYLSPGDEVEVRLLRDDAEEKIDVVLGSKDDQIIVLSPRIRLRTAPQITIPQISIPQFRPRGHLGVHLQEMTEDLREYFGAPSSSGVLISKVEEDSPAESAGLSVGDVIVEADGEDIESSSDLRDVLGDKEKGDTFDIVVYRDGRSETFEVTADEVERQIFDINSQLWCGEDDEDCEGLGTYNFNFDRGGKNGQGAYVLPPRYYQRMEKLQQYLDSEEFQERMKTYYDRSLNFELQLEKKNQILEEKLRHLEERLEELLERDQRGSRPASLRLS